MISQTLKDTISAVLALKEWRLPISIRKPTTCTMMVRVDRNIYAVLDPLLVPSCRLLHHHSEYVVTVVTGKVVVEFVVFVVVLFVIIVAVFSQCLHQMIWFLKECREKLTEVDVKVLQVYFELIVVDVCKHFDPLTVKLKNVYCWNCVLCTWHNYWEICLINKNPEIRCRAITSSHETFQFLSGHFFMDTFFIQATSA